ncbi:MAG: DUF1549 domain-containing protein, partial [Pirellulaceae bacterium]
MPYRLFLLVWILAVPAFALRADGPTHWAFVPPRRPALPDVRDREWPTNAVDRFVLSRLEARGMHPAPRADRATRVRRLWLDLTGLPPSPTEVQEFREDSRPDAWNRLVARLLDSPHFGERMAQRWLDYARYADTHGYLIDSHREMWRWRDEVMAAFNRNLPFDSFTVEQLAGDLLPDATLSQRIASGFHRNHMINFENGALAEQYRLEYVADRVVTTGTVWLGLTLDCARCHDHKHDPLTMQDFYQLSAFFNQVPVQGLDGKRGNAGPLLSAPTAAQQSQLAAIDRQITELHDRMVACRARARVDIDRWEQSARSPEASPIPRADWSLSFRQVADDVLVLTGERAPATPPVVPWPKENQLVPTDEGLALLATGRNPVALPALPLDERPGFSIGMYVFPTTADAMALLEFEAGEGGGRLQLTLQKQRLELMARHGSTSALVHVAAREPLPLRSWQRLLVSWDDGLSARTIRLTVNGQNVPLEIRQDSMARAIGRTGTWLLGGSQDTAGWRGMLARWEVFQPSLSDREAAAWSTHSASASSAASPPWSDEERQRLRDEYLRSCDAEFRADSEEHAAMLRRRADILQAAPTVMVMADAVPRPTYVLRRGMYDQPGKRVTAATPAVLPAFPPTAPPNRLGLAQWLVAPAHPLTARVTVNRVWQDLFGAGLVRTPDDFGVRGDPPTHPDLLDWLAVEFVATGWDMKRLVYLLTTSATYQQSSRMTAEALAIDPENRWLGRAASLRLDAEVIRDTALAASGLLDPRLGGPSVFPYQPAGLWEELSYDPMEFTAQVDTPSRGRERYRRSLYTFWKRTMPPPA